MIINEYLYFSNSLFHTNTDAHTHTHRYIYVHTDTHTRRYIDVHTICSTRVNSAWFRSLPRSFFLLSFLFFDPHERINCPVGGRGFVLCASILFSSIFSLPSSFHLLSFLGVGACRRHCSGSTFSYNK